MDTSEIAMQVDQIIEHGQPIHMIQYDQTKKAYIVSDQAREFL